jgi:hypothetical protein
MYFNQCCGPAESLNPDLDPDPAFELITAGSRVLMTKLAAGKKYLLIKDCNLLIPRPP